MGDDWPYSLRSNLQRLQWSAGGQVRAVPGELAGVVELQREALALESRDSDLGELLDFLNRLLLQMAALTGFALDDMTRDDGWRFLMLGRRIERLQLADSLAAFLRGAGARDQAESPGLRRPYRAAAG